MRYRHTKLPTYICDGCGGSDISLSADGNSKWSDWSTEGEDETRQIDLEAKVNYWRGEVEARKKITEQREKLEREITQTQLKINKLTSDIEQVERDADNLPTYEKALARAKKWRSELETKRDKTFPAWRANAKSQKEKQYWEELTRDQRIKGQGVVYGVPDMKCSTCGNYNEENAQFCGGCGTNLKDGSQLVEIDHEVEEEARLIQPRFISWHDEERRIPLNRRYRLRMDRGRLVIKKNLFGKTTYKELVDWIDLVEKKSQDIELNIGKSKQQLANDKHARTAHSKQLRSLTEQLRNLPPDPPPRAEELMFGYGHRDIPRC